MLAKDLDVFADQDLAYNYKALLYALKSKRQITADYALFEMGVEVKARRRTRSNKKYTDADVNYIRTEFNNGRTWVSIAAEYGLSTTRIRTIAGYNGR